MLTLMSPSLRLGLQRLCRWLCAGAAGRFTEPRRFRPQIECLERRELLTGGIIEYAIPTSNSGALDITPGRDGNMWFVEQCQNKVAKITPTGQITEYAVSGDPVDIVAGPGTSLWFGEFYANKVGEIDSSTGQITEFNVPTSGAGPNGISMGADGNMWFAEYFAGKIGRITPSGQITEFSVGGDPTDLTLGSDGNVWFTSYNTDQVGKIDTSGNATLYAAPSGSGPAGIAPGLDGNLWITQYNSGQIAKVNTSGVFTELNVPAANSHPWAIEAGAGGALWFAESGSNKIGEVALGGQFQEYDIPTAGSDPRGITTGADGSVWWTEYGGNQIGTFMPQAPPTVSVSVTYGAQRTVTLSGQVTDAQPGGLTVNFSGMVVGSVVTNADGTFSATFQASGLGNVQAITTDAQGLVSNTATVTLASNPPTISNFVGSNSGGVWTFTGKVNDSSPAGLTVSFGGLPSLAGKTATVQADGTFELVVALAAGEQGTVTAQTTNWWGQNSNVAQWVVAP
jgi:virginiamycin B lyase